MVTRERVPKFPLTPYHASARVGGSWALEVAILVLVVKSGACLWCKQHNQAASNRGGYVREPAAVTP